MRISYIVEAVWFRRWVILEEEAGNGAEFDVLGDIGFAHHDHEGDYDCGEEEKGSGGYQPMGSGKYI
jgi:hypothetical protein